MDINSFIFFFVSCSVFNIYKKPMYVAAHSHSHPEEWAQHLSLQDLSLQQRLTHEFVTGFDLDEKEMEKFHIWPLGIIPYYIDDFSFDKVLRDRIRHNLDIINRVTGLHFLEIPRPPEDDQSRWVLFLNRNGQQDCGDVAFNDFTNEGVQRVVLGYNCISSGSISEIVLALVGVPPQHNAPNRDENIIIHKDNILPEKLHLFEALQNNEWLFHDIGYDLDSAGHFLPHQHTKNGAATITIKHPEKLQPHYVVSPRSELSFSDIQKIKSLYNYISKKRQTPLLVRECNKLFVAGANFSKIRPKENNVKPLKKPNLYLGVEKESSADENEVSEMGDASKEDEAPAESNASEEGNSTEATDLARDSAKEILSSENEHVSEKVEGSGKVALFNETTTNEPGNINKDKSISDENTLNDQPSNINNVTRDKNYKYMTHYQQKKDTLLGQSDYRTSEERSSKSKRRLQGVK